MVLFKRKKVLLKTEIKESNNESLEMYSENVDYKPKASQVSYEDIITRYDQLQPKIDNLVNSYYRYRIFSKIASKDNKFNQLMLTIDKHLNRINKEYKEFKKDILFLKHGDYPEDFLDKVSEKLINIEYFYQTISNNLDELMKKYFSHMKMATANICMNRTNKELDAIYKRLNTYLNDFKNLNEAASYIFYNSGQEIVQTIDSLIKALPNQNEFTFKYFLQTDDIITLDLKEWIDLYNKIRFVMKKKEAVNENENFLQNYLHFEILYLILMMNMESHQNKITDYQI